MMTNLILIDPHDAPGVWRLKMYEGHHLVSEAVCDPIDVPDLLTAMDGWRESMFWRLRDKWIPARSKS